VAKRKAPAAPATSLRLSLPDPWAEEEQKLNAPLPAPMDTSLPLGPPVAPPLDAHTYLVPSPATVATLPDGLAAILSDADLHSVSATLKWTRDFVSALPPAVQTEGIIWLYNTLTMGQIPAPASGMEQTLLQLPPREASPGPEARARSPHHHVASAACKRPGPHMAQQHGLQGESTAEPHDVLSADEPDTAPAKRPHTRLSDPYLPTQPQPADAATQLTVRPGRPATPME